MTRYFMLIALCMIAPLAPAEIVCSENIFSMQQQQLPTEGWHLKSDKNDYKIYNRKISGKKIREVLALAELELSARQLFAAISDYDHYSEFMPYVKKAGYYNKKIIDHGYSRNWISLGQLPIDITQLT